MARVVPGGGAQVGVQMMPGCPGPSGSAKCEEQGAPTSGLCHIDDERFADPLHLVNSSGDYTGVPLGGVGVGFFDYAPDGEIKRVAAPGQSGRLAKLLDTRVRSAFQGRVLLTEQPAEYRTGLSAADEQALIDCVQRHFSFAPLDQAAEIALAIEVDQVGAALEQGLGVRNQLYRARHESFRGGLPRDILPTSWDQLPQDCTDADRLAHAPAVC